LNEVIQRLQESGSTLPFEVVIQDHDPVLKESRAGHNSLARVSTLLHGLLKQNYDALVIDASMLPPRIPSGLTLGAITERLTPCDALISADDLILDELPEGCVVIASDKRREAQMLYYRPDLSVLHAKGSVDSLMQKVSSEGVDAAIVAAADMERLNRHDAVVELLTTAVCVPAAGQGALAVLVRSDEDRYKEGVRAINDHAAYSELRAELAFLDRLGLSRDDPVGVLASIENKAIELEGAIVSPDGRERIYLTVKGVLGHEEDLGGTLADELLEAGGREILQELHLW